jgi:hypothetical protein
MKLFGPDALWRSDMVSGALFLYFNEEPIVSTLHPSVSTFLTGVDPTSFFRLVAERRPTWWPQFEKLLGLCRAYRVSLDRSREQLEPLATRNKTVWLVYPRDQHALDEAQELLTASSLKATEVASLIDPYSAADELFAHLFLEKVLEFYGPGPSQQLNWGEGEVGWDPMPRREVDWSVLYQYCQELFSSSTLEQLLTRVYMLRLSMLRNFDGILLSNERLVPFLTSLPVDAPAPGQMSSAAWDVVGWEFFRQLVSPRLDPLDGGKAKLVASLLSRRSAEIERLKGRCLHLGQQFAEDQIDLTTLQGSVQMHIRANVQKEVQAALDLDRDTAEGLLTEVLADEKAWLAIGTLVSSLALGGPIVTAGSVIYAVANLGSKGVAAAGKRRERLKSDDFALLYRMKSA